MATLEEKLRFCAVKVNRGSGCVFQPATTQFTYVLTVTHNIVDNDSLMEARDIHIFRDDPEGTHFPVIDVYANKELDIAILKIAFLTNDFDFYSGQEYRNEKLSIYGYPDFLHKDGLYRATKISCTRDLNIIGTQNFEMTTDQPMTTFNQGAPQNLMGLSGSGIFKIDGENIILKGIFPQLNDPEGAHNKVNGSHLLSFNDLLKSHNQPELLPNYLMSFEFLKDDAFRLDVAALNEGRIASTRMQLKNKVLDVINSDITPIGIKDLFNERLLLNERDIDGIDDRVIWRAWLEFLTIINLIKDIRLRVENLEEIFKTARLKYTHSEDEWTSLLSTDVAYSDYRGLASGGKVLIQTKKACKEVTILKKGQVPSHIGNGLDESKIKVDNGLDNPFAHFDFIHIDHFTRGCIINKLQNYETLEGKEQIIEALRNEYLNLMNDEG